MNLLDVLQKLSFIDFYGIERGYPRSERATIENALAPTIRAIRGLQKTLGDVHEAQKDAKWNTAKQEKISVEQAVLEEIVRDAAKQALAARRISDKVTCFVKDGKITIDKEKLSLRGETALYAEPLFRDGLEVSAEDALRWDRIKWAYLRWADAKGDVPTLDDVETASRLSEQLRRDHPENSAYYIRIGNGGSRNKPITMYLFKDRKGVIMGMDWDKDPDAFLKACSIYLLMGSSVPKFMKTLPKEIQEYIKTAVQKAEGKRVSLNAYDLLMLKKNHGQAVDQFEKRMGTNIVEITDIINEFVQQANEDEVIAEFFGVKTDAARREAKEKAAAQEEREDWEASKRAPTDPDLGLLKPPTLAALHRARGLRLSESEKWVTDGRVVILTRYLPKAVEFVKSKTPKAGIAEASIEHLLSFAGKKTDPILLIGGMDDAGLAVVFTKTGDKIHGISPTYLSLMLHLGLEVTFDGDAYYCAWEGDTLVGMVAGMRIGKTAEKFMASDGPMPGWSLTVAQLRSIVAPSKTKKAR